MDLLDSPIRGYAWGSRTAIAAVQGRPTPAGGPEAELWMGAHPGAPSRLVRDGHERTLIDVIEADPVRELGPAVVGEHGPRLPFLLKLLAAEQPLSIQAHPDAEQARAGFAAEEAAGIARDDPARNYVDPCHKPELLYAVTDFDALCGFRAPAQIHALLSGLELPALEPYAAALVADPGAGGVRSAFSGLLTLPGDERADLVGEVVAAARRLAEPEYRLVADLGERYPADVGVLAPVFLSHLRLRPGEVIFLPAGRPHCYLRGLCVELLANSDNVLRGGLTGKHVDVAELLRVLRFEPGEAGLLPHREVTLGVWEWRPPVREFVLTRASLGAAAGPVTLAATGPRILFCLDGVVQAENGAAGQELRGGQSVFIGAGSPVTLSGAGTVFQATTA